MLTHAHRMQWVAPVLTVALVAVIAGALLWLDAEPEYRRVQSADGVVTVEGLFPSGLLVTITEDKGASGSPWTAVMGSVYVIEPDDVLLPSPATVTFKTEQTNPAVAFFDTDQGLWVPLETIVDRVLMTASVQTNHFSHWALMAPSPLISEADRDALIHAALDAAPSNAHAYSVDLAYATVEGDFVLVEEGARADRCAENAVGRTQRVTTTTDRPATVYIKNEARSATLRAVIHWETGSPCPDLLQ
ncbi:MAG: hypothetical protein AAB898_00600 [Patescibacteria group bacterium]